MNLFLDTSVLLAAAASATGASRAVFRLHARHRWTLLATPYVLAEVLHNLPKLPPSATREWEQLHPLLRVHRDVLTLDRVVVFGPAKDRPILFSALAYADVLLTLDRDDFGTLMEAPFYGLRVQTPGAFLERERAAGRLP